MNSIFLALLLFSYALPVIWVIRSQYARKRRFILIAHFVYPLFSEALLVFFTGHISYVYSPNPDLTDQSLSTYYLFAIGSRVIMLLGYYYIAFRTKRYTKRLPDTIISRLFNYKKISIVLIVFLLIWIFVSAGTALISPRIAYQNFRSGNGFVWAFMVSLSTYLISSISLSDTLHSVKNIKLYLSLFEFSTYASGSKGVLLWNNVIALLLMKPSQVISIFKVKQLSAWKKTLTPLVFIPFLMWTFLLFGGSGPDGLVQKLATYMSSTKHAVQYIQYVDKNDDYTNGQILTTNFWSFVPRKFFPSKPFAYGSILMNEKLFPGMAETGHTPSLGLFTKNYSDFQWLGIFVACFSPAYLLSLYGIHLVVSRPQISSSLSVFSVLFTAFPMISFHIPIIFSLCLYSFLLSATSSKVGSSG